MSQSPSQERHPPGLYVLFFTEMWERFGYYLMLGILPFYLTDSQKGGLGLSDKEGFGIVGTYIAFVYLTPFVGGLLADRVLGFRPTIVIGGILMMLGYFMLGLPFSTPENMSWLYLSLLVIIIGNGAFKPNISTLLGNLYPQGSVLKDAGYNIFYMGINIGAFACNFVAAFVRNYFDKNPWNLTEDIQIRGWQAAFMTAGVGMLIGTVTFILFYGMFKEADPDPKTKAGGTGQRESLWPLWLECVLPAFVVGLLGFYGVREKWFSVPFSPETFAFLIACLPVMVFYARIWLKVPDSADRGRVAALLVIFVVVIVFWMIFHLNTTALSAFARDSTDRVPTGIVATITDAAESLAENAPPDYYMNAGPEVPRPARESFKIVSAEEYKRLEKERKLEVRAGEPVFVTQEMFDRIYKNATAATPLLPVNQHLRLANPELYASINPGWVVVLTPLVVAFFAFLRGKGLEPSTSAKIGIGLLLTACGPVIMYFATLASGYQSQGDPASKVSSWWLISTYFVVTIGELCLSPMGLSLVSKMSPANIRSFMMGGWFLSTSFGNKLSGIFGEVYTQWDHRTFWIVLAISGALCGGFIFLLLPWLNRQMATEAKK